MKLYKLNKNVECKKWNHLVLGLLWVNGTVLYRNELCVKTNHNQNCKFIFFYYCGYVITYCIE